MRWKILILSVATFIGINVALGFALPVSSQLQDTDLFVWQQKKDTLDSGQIAVETLILGDSQAMSGILPEELLRHGIVAYNMGVPSQQPEGMEHVAVRIKSKVPAIRRVIINVSPFTLFKSEVWPAFQNYYRETYDPTAVDFTAGRFALLGRNAGDAIYRGLHALPIFKMRDRLAPVVAHASPLQLATPRISQNNRVRKTLVENQGYWVWQSEDSFACGTTMARVPPLASLKYQERPESIQSYTRLVGLLREQGLEVVLVFIPLSEIWAGLAAPGTEERVHAAMRRFEQPHVKIVPMPPRAEYSGLFHDWTHLNYCGAKKYSGWLAEKMGHPLARR